MMPFYFHYQIPWPFNYIDPDLLFLRVFVNDLNLNFVTHMIINEGILVTVGAFPCLFFQQSLRMEQDEFEKH